MNTNFHPKRLAVLEEWLLAQERGEEGPKTNDRPAYRQSRKERGLAKCFKWDKRYRIITRDGEKCLRRGEPDWSLLTLDHIDPFLSKTHINKDANLQTLCVKCNGWKKTQVIDFRKSPK